MPNINSILLDTLQGIENAILGTMYFMPTRRCSLISLFHELGVIGPQHATQKARITQMLQGLVSKRIVQRVYVNSILMYELNEVEAANLRVCSKCGGIGVSSADARYRQTLCKACRGSGLKPCESVSWQPTISR